MTRAAYFLTFSGTTTHVGLVVARCDGSLGILEATPGHPVQVYDIRNRVYDYPGAVGVRRRITPVTPEQCAQLTAFSGAQVGKSYHLMGMLAPPVSFPFRVFSTRIDPLCLDRPRWICSSLVLRTCICAGLLCPERINPEGACASDLATDVFLDLSCGWEAPAWFVKP